MGEIELEQPATAQGGGCSVIHLGKLGSLTTELSSNLIKSIVVPPGGLMGWLTRSRTALSREKARPERPETRPDEGMDRVTAETPLGPVVLMGFAPVPDEAVVESVHLAGGRSARMAVVPVAAAADPAATTAESARLFTRYGMKRVEILELDTREKAVSPEWVDRLSEFDAVVLCGESVVKGLEVLQATLAAATLKKMGMAGKLLVGLGAGAALLGGRVFPSSNAEGATPGLGILPGLLLETDSAEGTRLQRLPRAAGAPDTAALLGIELPAGSAVLVQGGEAKVLGEGVVTFVDGRPRQKDGAATAGPQLHELTEGYRIHLRNRRVVAPVKEEIAAR